MNIIKNSLFLLGNTKIKIFFMMILFIMSSTLDIIGLGLIAPYISLIFSSESINNYEIIKYSPIQIANIDHKEMIIYSSILLCTIFLFKTIVSIFVNWKIFEYILGIRAFLQIKLAKINIELNYSNHLKKNSEDAIDNLQILVERSCNSIQAMFRLLSEIITVIFISLFLLYTNVKAFATIFLILGIVSIIYYRFFTTKAKKYGELSSISNRNLIKNFQDSFSGYKHIHIFGGKSFFLNRIDNEALNLSKYALIVSIITSSPRYIIEFILVLLITGYISFMYIDFTSIDLIASLGVFAFAAVRLMPSANNILNHLSIIKFGNFAITELAHEIGGIKDYNIDTGKNITLDKFNSLQVKDLYFKHSATNLGELNNINFKINKGEIIGISGASGAGKTTVLDLLMGFLNPSSGNILINDIEIKDCLNSWRSKIDYLPQQTFLINDSIINNIILGNDIKKVNNKKLEQSIEMAMLSEYINELPAGLNTIVGENGSRISGGQKQRIALARAFYYDREIFILDESTSALDSRNEEQIFNIIEKLKKYKTFIIISHRVSSIEICDKKLILNQGRMTNN